MMDSPEFTRGNHNRVICTTNRGKISSQTVESNLLLSILEKLTEISETNKAMLDEVAGIGNEFPPR